MHTENTETELFVFSVCIFSVAGMCTKQDQNLAL